jgi:hypothetical protein
VTTPTCPTGIAPHIVQLRNLGASSNDVMYRIERDLDPEDSRLES